jgi:Protein of unknown function (DUF3300)/Chaperone of endosialidase
MQSRLVTRWAVLLALAFLPMNAPAALAQETAEDAGAGTGQQQLLDAGQLDQLVAPIALYPDSLLAQVLIASTYPLEVVQADRFAKSNKGLKGDKLQAALSKQDWDASLKSLVSTPTVLAMMNDKLDWTEKLGDAVLAQQADVMDAVQRLRSAAQSNGKLESSKQQTVKTEQQAGKQVIVIEPTSPETVYVPYYDPGVVYGAWPYPEYPPYYFPPAPGYVVGGALARGLAWGAGFAIGNAVWNNFDWGRGNINVDINRDVNINRNVNRNDVKFSNWQHNPSHRRGVSYNNDAVKNKFANANIKSGDRKLDYRGRSGEQVLKPGKGNGNLRGGPGGNRPDLGGKGPGQRPDVGQIQQGLKERPGNRPEMNQIQQGLKERGGKQAALGGGRPDLGKAKGKGRPGGNGFDPSDGRKAKDFSNRGQASLGNRGAADFSRPSGGGGAHRGGGGGGHVSRGGGRPGGGHVSRGGGGGGGHVSRGGGGRGGGGRGGGRRSDIRLKEDVVPLVRLSNGLELYRFRYKGHDHTAYVGVMAQEVQKVQPSAVWRDHDGYLVVDYDRIGLQFMTWKEWLARTSHDDDR